MDISLATDLLGHATADQFDLAVLVAGDADYIPLIEAVKRLGKRVWVGILWRTTGTATRCKGSGRGRGRIPWLAAPVRSADRISELCDRRPPNGVEVNLG